MSSQIGELEDLEVQSLSCSVLLHQPSACAYISARSDELVPTVFRLGTNLALSFSLILLRNSNVSANHFSLGTNAIFVSG